MSNLQSTNIVPEVTVKYKSDKALKALQDLSKVFDLAIDVHGESNYPENNGQRTDLPITFSENPDIKALAGIWEGRNVTL